MNLTPLEIRRLAYRYPEEALADPELILLLLEDPTLAQDVKAWKNEWREITLAMRGTIASFPENATFELSRGARDVDDDSIGLLVVQNLWWASNVVCVNHVTEISKFVLKSWELLSGDSFVGRRAYVDEREV